MVFLVSYRDDPSDEKLHHKNGNKPEINGKKISVDMGVVKLIKAWGILFKEPLEQTAAKGEIK